MDYKIDSNGYEATVTFQGDITFSENVKFREMLSDVTTTRATDCVFDLSEVGMVDSAGLGMFLIALEQSKANGWSLKVVGAQGHVMSMLKLTKLADLVA